jgi:hypothetical protein
MASKRQYCWAKEERKGEGFTASSSSYGAVMDVRKLLFKPMLATTSSTGVSECPMSRLGTCSGLESHPVPICTYLYKEAAASCTRQCTRNAMMYQSILDQN